VWHALSKKPSFLFVVAIFDFVLRSYWPLHLARAAPGYSQWVVVNYCKFCQITPLIFCVPYLGICKSQNVLVNIYCNSANELFVCRNYCFAVTRSCLHFWRWSGRIYNN